MPKPIIAIVGRPNVGKSALFNRLAQKRIAVVEDVPGVTRDRLYADADIGGRICSLVDTGGFDPTEKQGLMPQVVAQTRFAIAEADVIVFVVDAAQELTSLDYAVADELRKTRKPIVVAANKADDRKRERVDFHEIGLQPVIPVSSLHGRNVETLVDAIANELQDAEVEEEEDSGSIKIAVVGRPNVGKSALTNAILGEQRTIVSEIPGTTRDAIDTRFAWKGKPVTLIDTAGMRRKAKVKQALEYHTVLRSLRAVDRADVVFVVVESSGVTEQDSKIGGYAHEAGKVLILVVNKWDLIESQVETVDPKQRKRHLNVVRADFRKNIHAYLAFMEYAPVHFVSALRGEGIAELMDDSLRLLEQSRQRVSTGRLNAVIRDAIAEHSPPTLKGRRLKVRYVTQAEAQPPMFVLFVNDPELLHFSYRRYLENQIREKLALQGVPIRVRVRASHDKER